MIVLKGLDAPVNRIVFTPDASAVLADSGAGVRFGAIWSLPGGPLTARVPGLVLIAPGPEGETCLAIGNGPGGSRLGNVCVADGRFTAGPLMLWPDGWPTWLRLSPDRTRLAAGAYQRRVSLWSWPDLALLANWTLESCGKFHAVDAAFSPDGARLAVFQHAALTLHKVATGRIVWTAQMSAAAYNGCLAWSPDGRWIAAGGGKRLRVFDAGGSLVTESTQASKHFLDVEFTHDGRFLATVSTENTVKFFDTSSWQPRHELAWQVGGLRAIAFSRDGMLAAAGGAGKKVVVWDHDL